MRRMPQAVLIVATLANAWLLMQAVHELGHLLAAWLSGGEVSQVVLHPLTISRTDLRDNPSPEFVCWTGPIFGALAPVIVWAAMRWCRATSESSVRFFAGFCLIANGAYLAVGARDGIGDAGDLLNLGFPPWTLYLFGAATIPCGLWLWNGLGTRFGIGPDADTIPWHATIPSVVLLSVVIALEVLLSASA